MKKIGLFLLFSFSVMAADIPKDTSYTARSTYMKLKKEYHRIRIERPFYSYHIKVYENLTYASIEGRDLHLDLVFPADTNGKPIPVVVLVHGGGWQSGDKSLQMPMATNLAWREYGAAAVEYRLSPEARYPAAIHDIKAAIRWLRSQTDNYPIDSNRIAILGCSAGAQIASLIGCTNGMKKFEGNVGILDFSSSVQAIINIDGVVDFTCPEALKYENDPRKNPSCAGAWFGGNYETKPELWKEASPVYYVNAETPPILFINSAVPRFHAGRDSMLAEMSGYGIYNEVHTLPETPHTFWLFDPWFMETVDWVEAFLRKTFH